MKQLVNQTQGQTILGLSLLFMFIAGVGTFEATPQMFSKILTILLAFVGIIGAVKVFKKFKNGASDIQPAATAWFGSFLMLLVGNTIIVSVFVK